jgi:hypothetical protein
VVELRVTADVIAMAVRVRDDQLQIAVGQQVVDDRAQIGVSGAGVEQ